MLLKQEHANEHQVLPWKNKRINRCIPESEPDDKDHDKRESIFAYSLIAVLILLPKRYVLNVIQFSELGAEEKVI